MGLLRVLGCAQKPEVKISRFGCTGSGENPGGELDYGRIGLLSECGSHEVQRFLGASRLEEDPRPEIHRQVGGRPDGIQEVRQRFRTAREREKSAQRRQAFLRVSLGEATVDSFRARQIASCGEGHSFLQVPGWNRRRPEQGDDEETPVGPQPTQPGHFFTSLMASAMT